MEAISWHLSEDSKDHIEYDPNISLVPDLAAADFIQTWIGIRKVENLYIPMGITKDPGDRRVRVGQEVLWFFIDQIFLKTDVHKLGLVFTDRSMLRKQTQFLATETAWTLRRFFEDNNVDGLLINRSCPESHDQHGVPNLSYETASACTVPKVTLAEIVGLLLSPDPQADKGCSHTQIADLAIREDNPYVALYHAKRARENNDTLREAILSQIAALLDLGLTHDANGLIQTCIKRNSDDERLLFHYARVLTISGRPHDALAQINMISPKHVDSLGHLETGRAFIAMGEFEKAQMALRRSLELEPGHFAAELAMGISLRDQHYNDANPHGLAQAEFCFEKVLVRQGYHLSEIFHHLCTIYFALGKFEKAKSYAKRCLQLRDNAIARRYLILCLNALGQMDEAKKEAGFQRVRHPEEIKHLEKYGL